MVDLPVWFYFWFWRAWVVAFLVVETLAILDRKPGDTLTEQVRPIFLAHPLLWFLAAGLLTWMWVHFLIPSVERAMLRIFV